MNGEEKSAVAPAPPVAKILPVVTALHGEVRVDNYAYMRDRSNPEVIAGLEAENAYTDAMTKHEAHRQEALYDEMLARIQEDDSQVPVKKDDWFYYSRTETGKAYSIYCRRHVSPGSVEEIYFDQNAAAAGHEFYNLGGLEVSPDHRYLALLVDTAGYEEFTLEVRDLVTGSILPDRIEGLGFGLAWASDRRTLFYETTDDAKRADRVWRHRLGDDRAADVAVYHDADVLFNVEVARSRNGAFIFLTSGSFTSDETWVLDATDPGATPRLVTARSPDLEYAVDQGGEWFYIVTNQGGARNFKIMRAPVTDPATWEEWIPHRGDVFVEAIEVFRDFVVIEERHGGLRRLCVRLHDGDDTHYVTFPEAAYGVFLNSNPEFGTGTLRFTYASFVTPASVYDYDVARRTRELLKQDQVLGGYDAGRYAIERLMAPARDGTPVPISLVYRAPFTRDGSRPLLLYAYGSYGATMEPTFNSQRFSLVDRGFVYAIAHVRGGQEMGRQWYDDGKMMKKWNTFHDFIDCAEFLSRERYTSPDRLVAHGGSAGGLLMGVIANERADLFHAIVADVPFVDVVNTMLDASIPLTAQEWEQWGNPNRPADYAYMRSYSPYDNVGAREYPRMLVTSGLNDSRVAYWEPAKWVARLRALKTDRNVLLLKMNMGAGHGGASGRYERLKEQAFRYAFILDQTLRSRTVPDPDSMRIRPEPSPTLPRSL